MVPIKLFSFVLLLFAQKIESFGCLDLCQDRSIDNRLGYRYLPSTSTERQKKQSFQRRNMFTGIIEEMGVVTKLEERDDLTLWDGSVGKGTVMTVQGDVVLNGAYLGCSIAVSGVCLTATSLSAQQFTVGLAPETLRRTYLGDLQPGDAVNLERASEIGGRNSGHFVQGHVDAIGNIVDRWTDEDSLFYRIQVDPSLMAYIVPKGFIAIDGTSLTVCETDPLGSTFTFMLIEYTQKKIVVPTKLKGDRVNVEVDVLAKYSEAALSTVLPKLEILETKVKELEAEIARLKHDKHA